MPVTLTELTAYGTFFSGVGTLSLAAAAFWGIIKWKEQATYKDKFDLAREAVELACKAESAVCSLDVSRSSYLLPSLAEDSLAISLPQLVIIIGELDAISFSIEALFSKDESELFIKLSRECSVAHFHKRLFSGDIIAFTKVILDKNVAVNENKDTSDFDEMASGLRQSIEEKKQLFTKITSEGEEDVRLSFYFQGFAKEAKQAMKKHLKRK